MVTYGLPLPIAVLACLLAGTTCGLLSGLVVIRWAIPSFIVTLGMMEIARRGSVPCVSRVLRPQYIGSGIEVITDASFLGLSAPFLLAFLFVIAGQITLAAPRGSARYMIAIGTNEEAARLSGVNDAAGEAVGLQ